jgi:4a-hydroxytetrahydrobiopterin dehydratase
VCAPNTGLNRIFTLCAHHAICVSGAKLDELQRQLDNDWKVIDGHHLEKTFFFKNFREALNFTNQIGEMAEAVGHHPDIFLTWGKVRLNIFTHKVNGLTENDFVLAAKFEDFLSRRTEPGTAPHSP